jgi:glycosyltransferase involved in cell wall biosynthesis
MARGVEIPEGEDRTRPCPHAPVGDEVEHCLVRWVGDPPDWTQHPDASAAIDPAVASPSLDMDLWLSAAAPEFSRVFVFHVTVEEAGAIPELRRTRPDAAIVLDLTDESLVKDVRRNLKRAAAADLTLVGSRVTLRELRRRRPALAAKTALLPRPVDVDTFVPRRALDLEGRFRLDELRSRHALRGPVVLCPTRLGFPGGLDLALHGIELVRARGHEVSIVVLAEGENSRMESRTKTALARVGALLLDRVDPSELPIWYAAADVVCLPARSATVSTPARLAAAVGVPTLASEVDPYLEVVKDGVTGHLFPVDDVAALGRAMEHVISDDVHARRLGAAARERAEHEYSPGHSALRLVALWQESARAQARRVSALSSAR